jgi:Zn-dependent protease
MSGRWVDLLYLVPILLISLTVHEVSHGWVAYRMGDPTAKSHGRLSLNPLKQLDPIGTAMFIITYLFWGVVFGWAKPIPISPYYFKNRQRGMAIVGAAGPASNFIMAVIFGLILRFAGPPLEEAGTSTAVVILNVLFMFVQINIVLGVFNLLPIPPLDGSRVVGAFLPRRAYEYWVAIDRYGFMIIIVLLIVLQGQVGRMLSGAFSGIWNLIFIGTPYVGLLG